jgi:hypothetical protein
VAVKDADDAAGTEDAGEDADVASGDEEGSDV